MPRLDPKAAVPKAWPRVGDGPPGVPSKANQRQEGSGLTSLTFSNPPPSVADSISNNLKANPSCDQDKLHT
jgi:hypothetical protein